MIKEINGETWFCCPNCGKKIHPVKHGARGVYVVCKQKRQDGTRCNWSGEIKYGGLVRSVIDEDQIKIIESVIAKGDRIELIPVKDGVKIIHVKREEVK